MSAIKSITNKVELFTVLFVVTMAANVKAQPVASGNKLFYNLAGHYSTQSHDFHNIGPGYKSYLSAEEWGVLVSISPTWWIGQKSAIELEIGYWATSVNWESSVIDRRPVSSEKNGISSGTWFVMPHFLLSFGTVDSVFVPYAKVGFGYFTGDHEGVPIGWSAGLGAFLSLNSSLSVKFEASYKLNYSNTGSHVTLKDDWQGIYLSTGIGVDI